MSKQRHRRRSQGGTTPETTPQTGSGVAHFSVSEVVQFWMSVDSRLTPSKAEPLQPTTAPAVRAAKRRRRRGEGWVIVYLPGFAVTRRADQPLDFMDQAVFNTGFKTLSDGLDR
jgi:hypothetical protein